MCFAWPACCGSRYAQDDVHIAPRETKKAGDAAVDTAAQHRSRLKTHTKPLRKDVDLVLVPVTITDPMNRLVTGLEKENFELTDNGQPQEIRHFSSEDAPISLGVIFDISGSMSDKIDKSRQAVVEFFRTANPQDEFFLITFSDKPEVLVDFTSSVEDIQSKLVYAIPKGRTALLDAIYLGMNRMRKAHYERKALLIISDGGDNHSRYTEGEIKSMVREADVQIYGIGLFDADFKTPEEREGPALLKRCHRSYWWADVYHRLAQRTGGRGHQDWHRAAQPICARIPSNQSSTRWQVAEDQGETESSQGPAAAARVRQNWILCTHGIRKLSSAANRVDSAAGDLVGGAEFDGPAAAARERRPARAAEPTSSAATARCSKPGRAPGPGPGNQRRRRLRLQEGS